jgi:hypothetical protein
VVAELQSTEDLQPSRAEAAGRPRRRSAACRSSPRAGGPACGSVATETAPAETGAVPTETAKAGPSTEALLAKFSDRARVVRPAAVRRLWRRRGRPRRAYYPSIASLKEL